MNEDIVDKLRDLHKQATTERSHYYVASCCMAAIGEIERLRAILTNIEVLVIASRESPSASQHIRK